MQLSEEDKKEILENKKEYVKRIHCSAAFQRVFRGPDGELVLKEIEKFCGYKNDTFKPDSHKHAYAAGRRSVAVHIHNELSPEAKEIKKFLDAEDKKGRKSK